MPKTLDDVYYFMGFVLYSKKHGLYRKLFVLYSSDCTVDEDED